VNRRNGSRMGINERSEGSKEKAMSMIKKGREA
jgi:hypothetical protein